MKDFSIASQQTCIFEQSCLEKVFLVDLKEFSQVRKGAVLRLFARAELLAFYTRQTLQGSEEPYIFS